MEYQCGVCGQKVGHDMIVYIDHTEKHIVDVIKSEHPDWVEKNGLCVKCLSYYRGELKEGFFSEAQFAARRENVKKFFGSLFSALTGKK